MKLIYMSNNHMYETYIGNLYLETYAISSPVLFNNGLDKTAIICSASTSTVISVVNKLRNQSIAYLCIPLENLFMSIIFNN